MCRSRHALLHLPPPSTRISHFVVSSHVITATANVTPPQPIGPVLGQPFHITYSGYTKSKLLQSGHCTGELHHVLHWLSSLLPKDSQPPPFLSAFPSSSLQADSCSALSTPTQVLQAQRRCQRPTSCQAPSYEYTTVPAFLSMATRLNKALEQFRSVSCDQMSSQCSPQVDPIFAESISPFFIKSRVPSPRRS